MKSLSIPPLTKTCIECKVKFEKRINTSLRKWKLQKYCSLKCKNKGFKNKPSWNKGLHNWWTPIPKGSKRKMTPEWSKKLSDKARRTWDDKWTKEEQIVIRKKQIETKRKRNSFARPSLGAFKEKNPAWLGDKATYNSKHRWIQNRWKKTGQCQKCKKYTKPFGKRKWGTEWHNIDGKYDRENRQSWIELCPLCHRRYE
jgi:hypothetical protein